MKIKLFAVLSSAAFALLLGVSSAHASNTTIDFVAPFGSPYTGSTVEDGFVYSVAAGSLYRDVYGNPGLDMEGDEHAGGGILDIKEDGAATPFTFVQTDSLAYASRPDLVPTETLTINGYLNGTLVGSDTYILQGATAFNWITVDPNNLAGKAIDDLQISLPAFVDRSNYGFASVDNIVLHQDDVTTSPVPEPSSLALLGTGALGIAASVRRRFLRA